MEWFKGWGICIGKEGEFGRGGGMEDRHDSHTLRNRTISMWFSRDFPIFGHSSMGSSDQSTLPSMASKFRHFFFFALCVRFCRRNLVCALDHSIEGFYQKGFCFGSEKIRGSLHEGERQIKPKVQRRLEGRL